MLTHGTTTKTFSGYNALRNAYKEAASGDLITLSSGSFRAVDTVKVAVAYKEGDKVLESFPYDGGVNIEPVYKEFPGWKAPLSGLRRFEDFSVFGERAPGEAVAEQRRPVAGETRLAVARRGGSAALSVDLGRHALGYL